MTQQRFAQPMAEIEHHHPPRKRWTTTGRLAAAVAVGGLITVPIGAVSAQEDAIDTVLTMALALNEAGQPAAGLGFGVEFTTSTHPFFGEQDPTGGDLIGAAASIPSDVQFESAVGVDELGSVFRYDAPVDEFAIEGDSLLFTVEAPRQKYLDGSFFDVALLVTQPGLPVAAADPGIPFDTSEGFNLRASLSVIDGVPTPVYEQVIDGTWQTFQMPFDTTMITTDDRVLVAMRAPARFVAGAVDLEFQVSGFPTDSDDPDDIFIHVADAIPTPPPRLADRVGELVSDALDRYLERADGAADTGSDTGPAAETNEVGDEAEQAGGDLEHDSTTGGEDTFVDGVTTDTETDSENSPANDAATDTDTESESESDTNTESEPPVEIADDAPSEAIDAAPTAAETAASSTDSDDDGSFATLLIIAIVILIPVLILIGILVVRARRSDHPVVAGHRPTDEDWAAIEVEDQHHRNLETWHGVLAGIIGSARAAGHEADADGWITFTPAEFDRHFPSVGFGHLAESQYEQTSFSIATGQIPRLDADGEFVDSIDPKECREIRVNVETKEVQTSSPEAGDTFEIPSDVPVL